MLDGSDFSGRQLLNIDVGTRATRFTALVRIFPSVLVKYARISAAITGTATVAHASPLCSRFFL